MALEAREIRIDVSSTQVGRSLEKFMHLGSMHISCIRPWHTSIVLEYRLLLSNYLFARWQMNWTDTHAFHNIIQLIRLRGTEQLPSKLLRTATMALCSTRTIHHMDGSCP